ncbi:MAG: reactive intermediate/imine deaminase, partial [Synergistaceae bacterium]|nr:reactive intermediate/imine deaminase [Synergistaceae bacterium]
MKKIVSAKDAPAAVGPYSQAVWAGDLLYCSGQLGLDPKTGALAGPDVVSQAVQALENVKAILASQ